MQKRYFLGVSLQENFTHVQSPTTAAQLDSAPPHQRHRYTVHMNKPLAASASIVTNGFMSMRDCATHLYFQLYPSYNTNTRLVLSKDPEGS